MHEQSIDQKRYCQSWPHEIDPFHFGRVDPVLGIGKIARKSDLAGRIGGEEFAFFLSNTSAEQARSFAERLHQAVRGNSLEVDGAQIQYTVSIGLASFSEPVPIETALRLADRALYAAKDKGRNRTATFEVDASSWSEDSSLRTYDS